MCYNGAFGEREAMTEAQNIAFLTKPSNPIWRMSVGQYERMIEVGILTDEDPVELLEGCLVKNTK